MNLDVQLNILATNNHKDDLNSKKARQFKTAELFKFKMLIVDYFFKKSPITSLTVGVPISESS